MSLASSPYLIFTDHIANRSGISLLKSLRVDDHFLTSLLIGSLVYCQPIRSHARILFLIWQWFWQRIVSVTSNFEHIFFSLRWRHNGRVSVSNHQPHDCLLNRLCRRRSKKTSKLRVTGLCVGNSPGTGEFPAQMPSDAEKFSYVVYIFKGRHGRLIQNMGIRYHNT